MVSTDSFICLKCAPFVWNVHHLRPIFYLVFYMYFAKQKSYYLHLVFDSAIHCKHLFVSMNKDLLSFIFKHCIQFHDVNISKFIQSFPYIWTFMLLISEVFTNDSTLDLHLYAHFPSCTKISKEFIPRNTITDRNFKYMYLSFDIY